MEAGACIHVGELKRDLLGRVELVRCGDRLVVRRCRSRMPGIALVARLLARREQHALRALAGLDGVPAIAAPPAGRETYRSWIPGEPLSLVTELRRDFFDRLEALVEQLHERGVCHNDLHKEVNILVREDGTPAVIDFQLASVHAARGREFRRRADEDIRHVRKHRRRYLRGMAGASFACPAAEVAVPAPRRLSRLWRRLWKPF
ncbi:MAG TPA: serine/threonine protein kinase, partial [bacterium]|nr:serine/threonine protein kinase [bacterium]